MQMSRIHKVVLACTFLFLSTEVNSQRIRFPVPSYQGRRTAYSASAQGTFSSFCDEDSYCIPIQRCRALRDMIDWRTTGETCKFGYGRYRSVCCPRPPLLSLLQPVPLLTDLAPMPPRPAAIPPQSVPLLTDLAPMPPRPAAMPPQPEPLLTDLAPMPPRPAAMPPQPVVMLPQPAAMPPEQAPMPPESAPVPP